MENIERKLELVRMMRREQQENLCRLQRREHILYPEKKLSYSSYYLDYDNHFQNKNDISLDIPKHKETSKKQEKNVTMTYGVGLFLRIAICIGLFIGYILMKNNNFTFYNITCDMVENALEDDINLTSIHYLLKQ